MAKINVEDVVGIYDEKTRELLCRKCWGGQPHTALSEENSKNLLLQEDVDKSDDLYYCDICGENVVVVD